MCLTKKPGADQKQYFVCRPQESPMRSFSSTVIHTTPEYKSTMYYNNIDLYTLWLLAHTEYFHICGQRACFSMNYYYAFQCWLVIAVFLEAVSQQDKECNYHFWRLSCGYSSCHGRLQNQVNPLLNGYSDHDHCSSPSLWKIRAAGCAPSSSVLVAAEEHSFSDEDCRELVRECQGTILWMLGIGRPGDVQGLDNGHGQIRDSCCRLHGKCVVEWVPTKPFKCSLTRSLAWAQQSIGDQILSGDTGSYKVQGWPY